MSTYVAIFLLVLTAVGVILAVLPDHLIAASDHEPPTRAVAGRHSSVTSPLTRIAGSERHGSPQPTDLQLRLRRRRSDGTTVA